MKPTVGRIVHYTNLGDKDGKYPPQIIAAIVTRVTAMPGVKESLDENDYLTDLKAFYPTGFFDMEKVPFTTAPAGSDGARGKWTWPARE